MSDALTDPATKEQNGVTDPSVEKPLSADKGKGKAVAGSVNTSMEEDDDEEDDEDEDEEHDGEDVEMDAEELEDELDFLQSNSEILPLGTRRGGAKVDYTSKEAHEAAGLKPEEDKEDDEEDEFEDKNTSMEA